MQILPTARTNCFDLLCGHKVLLLRLRTLLPNPEQTSCFPLRTAPSVNPVLCCSFQASARQLVPVHIKNETVAVL